MHGHVLTLWAGRAAWSPALALLLEDVAGVLFRPSPARRPLRPQPAAAAAAPSSLPTEPSPAPHPDPEPAHVQQQSLAAAVRSSGDAGAAYGAGAPDAASPAVPAPAPDAAGSSSSLGSAAFPGSSADAAATSSAPRLQPRAEGAPAAVHALATAAGATAADTDGAAREAATTSPAACSDACAGDGRQTQGQPGPVADSGEAQSPRPLALAGEAGPGLGRSSPAASGGCPDPSPLSGGKAALVPLQPWQEESCAVAGDAIAEELSARIALYSCLLRYGQGFGASAPVQTLTPPA